MASEYKAITISNFGVQKASERFPSNDAFQQLVGHNGFMILPPPDEDDPNQPPFIAPWRSNLVALSQRHNLYFAAHGEKIHVTVPRGLKQIIPSTPDLILELPASTVSQSVGGYIDHFNPHFVNNMIVGNLGLQEILLLACDDGDVLAFYVHKVTDAITSGVPGATVKPFFHENVGASAWGLAIHGSSRLIAAACNRRQLTVFMPALTSDHEVPDIVPGIELPWGLYTEVDQLKRSSSGRKKNEKKIFRLGRDGHNIPSLSFADDPKGDAKSILATDIAGSLWIFALYTGKFEHVPRIHANPIGTRPMCMGWGVLVLPLKAFRRVDGLQQALGVQDLKRRLSIIEKVDDTATKVFDVAVPAIAIGHTPIHRQIFSGSSTSPLILEADSEDDSDGETLASLDDNTVMRLTNILKNSRRGDDRRPRPNFYPPPMFPVFHMNGDDASGSDGPGGRQYPSSFDWGYTVADAKNLVNMHPDDLRGMKTEEELHVYLTRLAKDKLTLGVLRKDRENRDTSSFLDNETAILRTYQHGIELIPPTRAVPRTLCRLVFRDRALSEHHQLRPYERLNLFTVIPQLSLVIVATQAGHAALITLTRADDSFSINGPVPTFRVDTILPVFEQLQDRTFPRRPLMGIAVAPIQTESAKIEDAKRWRLFMHYYNHTILTYELSRDYFTDALVVL